jgi:hypothetical protein
MHWDWATFLIGVVAGVVGGFLASFGLLLLFAKGMSDDHQW